MIERRRVKGVTLIEMLVVLAIIGIMTSLTMVSLGQARIEKQVEVAARLLASRVREIQNHTLVGRKIGTRVLCDAFISPVAIGDSSVSFGYRYRGTSVSCATVVPGTNLDSLPALEFTDGVVFQSANPITLTFKAPRAVLFSGNVQVAPQDHQEYRLSKGSARWIVCIYPSGRIEELRGNTCPVV